MGCATPPQMTMTGGVWALRATVKRAWFGEESWDLASYRGGDDLARLFASLGGQGTIPRLEVEVDYPRSWAQGTLLNLTFVYLPALSLLQTRRSTMLINTLKMPIYRAAADSIPITNQGHEAALFRHFPGFAFSERVRHTSSWLWQFGYDIQNRDSRRWACKQCIIANNPLPKNIHPSGLQNAAGHLYTKHFVLAPPDKPKLREEKKEAGRQGHYRASRVMSLTPEKAIPAAACGMDRRPESALFHRRTA
ncbi:PIF1-like helicase domain-containing protein [Apiospora kogelbergensis]|uniref:PIF1-like helicase domain-containing protein n=1 Tax=Apiospora kogelbergensis TaxID=1337665 RepID=UPI003131E8B1